MLRVRTIVAPRLAVSSGFLAHQRRTVMSEKVVSGATAAFVSSTAVIGMTHLFIIEVPFTILISTIAAGTGSGALAAIEGSKNESGATFGSVVGLFFGVGGAYFAKKNAEPWR